MFECGERKNGVERFVLIEEEGGQCRTVVERLDDQLAGKWLRQIADGAHQLRQIIFVGIQHRNRGGLSDSQHFDQRGRADRSRSADQ